MRLDGSTIRVPWKALFAAWLACLAFCFPVYWASGFLLHAVPALIRVVLFGDRLEFFRISVFGGMAAAVSSGTSPVLTRMAGPPARQDLVEVAVGVSALIVLMAARKRIGFIAGLAAAFLGDSALVALSRRMAFARLPTIPVMFVALSCFAAMVLGMRWLLPIFPARTVGTRAGLLIAAFVAPRVALRCLEAGAGILWFSPYWLALLMLPGAAAAVVASLPISRREEVPASRVGWRPAALGGLCSLLLAAALHWGGPAISEAFQRHRQEVNRAALADIPEVPPDAPYPKLFFQKGVNLTAEYPAPYDSEEARATLEALPQYGVNAVALVPYGFAVRGQPHIRLNFGPDSWENDEGIAQLARLAHARGLKVMLKPGVWVRDGFAGDLEFDAPHDRAVWFTEFGVFVEHYARLAVRIHADILCVGGELAKLSQYDAEWRRLISRTRGLYPGPLVYAANFGPEFESLGFWDALDYIGLEEYYPLPDDLSTEALVRKVEIVARKFQRPVILTEAGFPSSEFANRAPWEEPQARKVALDEQARCYEAVFRGFYRQPWFQGVYWWAIRTNGNGGRDDASLTPWGKPAMQVIKRWYTQVKY